MENSEEEGLCKDKILHLNLKKKWAKQLVNQFPFPQFTLQKGRNSHKMTRRIPDDNDEKSSSSTGFVDKSFIKSNQKFPPKAKKRFFIPLPTELVTELLCSICKPSKICSNLAKDRRNLPSPSQSGIFKRMIKCGEEQKIKIKKFYRNRSKEIKFGVTRCKIGQKHIQRNCQYY